MKLLLLWLVLSIPAFANQWTGPIIVGAGSATFIGSYYATYNSLIKNELKGWSHPETDTTTKLESRCGVEAEFHLLGDHKRNYLLFSVSNRSDEAVVIKTNDIKFILDEKDRYPDQMHSDYKINSGWWYLTPIAFPSKDEFKGVKRIKIQIPIIKEKASEVCLVETSFERYENIPLEENSYTAAEFLIDGGVALTPAGNTSELGKGSGAFGLEFNAYPRPNHGLGLGIFIYNGFKDSSNSKITSEFDKGEKYRASLNHYDLHYIYRHFLSKDVSLQWEPGIGQISIEDTDQDDSDRSLKSLMTLNQKLVLQWTFGSTPHYQYKSVDYFAGLGFAHQWIPQGKLNGQRIDGHLMSVILRFGMGF